MMRKVENINDIFKIGNIRKDLDAFNIVVKDIMHGNREIYSDNESYVIFFRDDFNIIWTKDNIDIGALLDIIKLLENCSNEIVICKKELGSILDIGFDYNDVSCMQCKNIRKPKECNGYLHVPTNYDVDVLSKYYFDYANEINLRKIKSLEDAYLMIQKLIDENCIYAWKDNKRIVSMASYSSNGMQSKICNVYTIPEARKRGYAQNLIYAITNEMLNDDLVPSIYIKDEVAYKLYKKIGYESVLNVLMFNSNNKVKIKTKLK